MTAKKEERPDEEIFTEKKKPDPWAAKPLTLEGTARLIHLLGGIFGNAAQQAAVQELLDGKPNVRAMWQLVISALGKDELGELLSIVTGKSKAWVEKNYSLLKAFKALVDFAQSEDLVAVLKNLRATATEMPNLVGAVEGGSQKP